MESVREGPERGGSGAGQGGGGVELPPAGGPGRAEPRALRRRRHPASARPVSPGLGREEGGLGARVPPSPSFGVSRPGSPCPILRWGAGRAGPGRPRPALSRPNPRPQRCPAGADQSMGATRPLECEQPRDPLSDFNGPGKPEIAGEPRAGQRRPLPAPRSPGPQGSLERCSFQPSHRVGPLGS